MIKNYSTFFGVVAAISILLYSSKYMLHDLYTFLKTNYYKAKVNKVLPFFSKNNTIFLSLSFIFSSLHVYSKYHVSTIFNSGYLTLLLVIFLGGVKVFNRKFIDLKEYLTMVPYLLLLSLVVHICFR